MIKFKDFTNILLPGDCIIELYRWDIAKNPELLLSLPSGYTWKMDKFFKPYWDWNFFEIRVEGNRIKLYITEEAI